MRRSQFFCMCAKYNNFCTAINLKPDNPGLFDYCFFGHIVCVLSKGVGNMVFLSQNKKVSSLLFSLESTYL